MLENLNAEQEKLIDSLALEWIMEAHCGDTFINKQSAAKTITKIYALAELKAPEVIFLSGPLEAKNFCKEKLKLHMGTFDYFGVGFDSGWMAFYDYFQRIGILEKDDKEFNIVNEFMHSGVWAVVMFENLVICIARPNTVKVDDKGNLHCENGVAIAFDDGYEEYAWHGTWVNKQIIMQPETLTKEQIIEEKNSEVSRAIAEKLGWDEYLKRVETVLVDKWFDVSTKSHYELYDFKNRKGPLQPRLLKMESPELNDGTRPYYIESVPPESKTCQAARRWQNDLSRPTIDECNDNPSLEFEIET